MKKIVIPKKELESFSKPDITRVKESTLYYRGNHLFKVLNPELRDRKDTILKLERLQGKELILPEYLLYDEDGFIGYVMHFFKEHKQLEEFIFGKLPFEERKRICIELCRIFTSLKKQDFAYYDIHPFNILYKDGDIKIADMDHGVFRLNRIIDSLSDFELFNNYSIIGNYHLALTILGLLFEDYRVNVLEAIKNNRRELIKYSPKKMKKLYKYITRSPMFEFDVSEYLEDIDEDYINGAKLILKK